jgi:hypothetical protein
MANQSLDSKKGESGNIKKLSIASNKSGQSDISNGIVELRYYESILQETVRVQLQFVDTGNSVNGKTVIEGLPLVGTEKTKVIIEDNNKNELSLDLYVNAVTPVQETTQQNLVNLSLVSKEHILNQRVRVNTRFDGKISDHVRKILTNANFLASSKDLDIEETQNNYNFLGNNKKPFYTCTWLAKKGVPNITSPGKTAGYFFYETSKGFNFRSIDKLLEQTPKRKLIFNETPDARGANIPFGYDGKILELESDNNINVQSKDEIGAYSTRIVLFDPFNCKYEIIKPRSEETEKSLKLAGKELPVFNSEFNSGRQDNFTRTTYMLIDRGSVPSGKTEDQINKSKEPNFDPKNILNQSTMRYNQLFTIKKTITIPGDFSLNAGDVIFVDIPEVSVDKKNQKPNSETGGLYIIADLCHFVSTQYCLTKLNLVRDSYGRKTSA